MTFNISLPVLFLVCLYINNCYCQKLSFPCLSPNKTTVSLFSPDLKQVKKFLEAQKITREEFKDAVVTQANIIKQIVEAEGGADNEDITLPITDLIKKYGYPVEEHEVVTDDGYILKMHRIPGDGSVVFLMHGFFEGADDYVTAGPESALAYYLHNMGYDVWMGNARGNIYSQRHVTLTPNCSEFWEFSIDEVGRYDLPAMIDYSLNITGQAKLAFVGHAFGNTAFFIMCSELPQYNDKISVMFAICPAAWMTNAKAVPYRYLAIDPEFYYTSFKTIGLNEIVGDNFLVDSAIKIVCENNPVSNVICANIIYLVFGFDLGQQNITNLPVNFGHLFKGASTKSLFHFIQGMKSERFCKFDEGVARNRELYNADTPPDYPVEKVTAPVALFYSNIDTISNVTDVQKLRDTLPNVVNFTLFDHYWHFDYIWSLDVNTTVNPMIHDLVQKYQG